MAAEVAADTDADAESDNEESLSQSKDAKAAAAAEVPAVLELPRKRGRPPGSRNKSTLAAEAVRPGTVLEYKLEVKARVGEGGKRKRGRPPGSKNKSTLAAEAARPGTVLEYKLEVKARVGEGEKRKRGRPPGAKNKSTLAAEVLMGVKDGGGMLQMRERQDLVQAWQNMCVYLLSKHRLLFLKK